MRYIIFIALFIVAGSTSAVDLLDLLQNVPRSWSILDSEKYNLRVEEAIATNETWPQSPLLLVLHLIGGDVDIRSLVIEEVKTQSDGADSTRIMCIRDGFLDDSVRGDWHEIDLRRLSDGTWRISALKVAIRCWRSENTDVYQKEPCP